MIHNLLHHCFLFSTNAQRKKMYTPPVDKSTWEKNPVDHDPHAHDGTLPHALLYNKDVREGAVVAAELLHQYMEVNHVIAETALHQIQKLSEMTETLEGGHEGESTNTTMELVVEGLEAFVHGLDAVTGKIPIVGQLAKTLKALLFVVENVAHNRSAVALLMTRIVTIRDLMTRHVSKIPPDTPPTEAEKALLGAIEGATTLCKKFHKPENETLGAMILRGLRKISDNAEQFAVAHERVHQAICQLNFQTTTDLPSKLDIQDMMTAQAEGLAKSFKEMFEGHVKLSKSQRQGQGQNNDALIRSVEGRWSGQYTAIPFTEVNIDESDILGHGGFAVVCKGSMGGTDVAVKMNRNDRMTDAALDSLFMEASILTKHSHPNLIGIKGVCRTLSNVYLVLEMAHCSLVQLLTTTGGRRHKLPFKVLREIGMQTADGLAFLHSSNTVHRDVKPQNILLQHFNKGQYAVKLCDFGTAKEMSADSCTVTSFAGGTHIYSAPEVLQGLAATTASDIFSFGVLLWELATGMVPWATESQNALLLHDQIKKGKKLPLERVPDPLLRSILVSCWSTIPKSRPTASEIKEKLKRWREAIPDSRKEVVPFHLLRGTQLRMYLHENNITDDIVSYVAENDYFGETLLLPEFLVEMEDLMTRRQTTKILKSRMVNLLESLRGEELTSKKDPSQVPCRFEFVLFTPDEVIESLFQNFIDRDLIELIQKGLYRPSEILEDDFMDELKNHSTLCHRKMLHRFLADVRERNISLGDIVVTNKATLRPYLEAIATQRVVITDHAQVAKDLVQLSRIVDQETTAMFLHAVRVAASVEFPTSALLSCLLRFSSAAEFAGTVIAILEHSPTIVPTLAHDVLAKISALPETSETTLVQAMILDLSPRSMEVGDRRNAVIMRAAKLNPTHPLTQRMLASGLSESFYLRAGREAVSRQRQKEKAIALCGVDQESVLMAAFCGDITKLTDFHTLSKSGQLTITMYAAWGGRIEAIEAAARGEAAHGGKGMQGLSVQRNCVTHYATMSGDVDTLTYCVANGGGGMSELNKQGSSMTQFAALSGSMRMLQHTMANGGGAINYTNEMGLKTIHFAAWGGNIDIIAYCIQKRGGTMADVTLAKTTVSHFAAMSGVVETLYYCVALGGGALTDVDSNGNDMTTFAKSAMQPEMEKESRKWPATEKQQSEAELSKSVNASFSINQ